MTRKEREMKRKHGLEVKQQPKSLKVSCGREGGREQGMEQGRMDGSRGGRERKEREMKRKHGLEVKQQPKSLKVSCCFGHCLWFGFIRKG